MWRACRKYFCVKTFFFFVFHLISIKFGQVVATNKKLNCEFSKKKIEEVGIITLDQKYISQITKLCGF